MYNLSTWCRLCAAEDDVATIKLESIQELQETVSKFTTLVIHFKYFYNWCLFILFLITILGIQLR